MNPRPASPVLQLSGVDMRFGRTQVLHDAKLRLLPGEVHALMGQNGAGKSTLIKVLTGVVSPTAGQMEYNGKSGWPLSPLEAQQQGVSTVYQEVNLCPNLTVAENIFAGRYPRKSWWKGNCIDWAATREAAARLLSRVGLDIDVRRRLSDYPVAIQQLVAIARALGIDARVLILDEPTSSLDDDEVKALFDVLRRLREDGLAILFVSHFIDQVYAIADRITVLRNGRWVGEWLTREFPATRLIEAMVGRELDSSKVAHASAMDSAHEVTPFMQTEGLARAGSIQQTDLIIRPREVLGIAGLLGAGRTELARLLFGLDVPDAGLMRINGEVIRFSSPVDAISHGLAMCPEERKTEGIFADLSVRENIAIALQAMRGLRRPLSSAEQREMAERYITLLGIRTPDADTPVGQLSGGNQQKVVIARWLATAPRLLILDEPTRGIDVAAKQEIMDQILRLAEQGMAVVFISSEMSEVVRVSQRILVLRDRRAVGELPAGSGEDAVYEMIANEHV